MLPVTMNVCHAYIWSLLMCDPKPCYQVYRVVVARLHVQEAPKPKTEAKEKLWHWNAKKNQRIFQILKIRSNSV